MLVATPGQTTAYSTLHNTSNNTSSSNNGSSNGSGGGNGGSTVAAASTLSKKTTTLNATNSATATSGTPKTLNNSNHSSGSVNNKNSLNSNTHSAAYTYHQTPKVDQTNNKAGNQSKMTATSSREIISSSVAAATASHSLKNENSTNNITTYTNTTTTKQQSFIQTLKDSVQKALISTTGSSSSSSTINNSIANKLSADNKLQNLCNTTTTSIQNVTSSSSSTSHNANKVSTTTSSTNSNNSVAAATQSSSSVSLVRGKYFSCSLSKLHTVAPTIIHRYPEERQKTSSADSLQKEMCHFKPIRVVPVTPWKSGSKSRGNSLRFPKANLATKKTEFVLKSNCDVNSRKRKQQQNRTQTDKINVIEDDDDDDKNEQENKEFRGIYKPKPSLTCLSNSVTTPNHQSAFVCLVAQMKSQVNLQSKRQLTPVKTTGTEEASHVAIKELFVRKRTGKKSLAAKDSEVSKELPKSRSTRLSFNKRDSSMTVIADTVNSLNSSKENDKRVNAKTNNISKTSRAVLTKAKSRRTLASKKSKTVNLVTLAHSKGKEILQSKSMPAVAATSATKRRTRKRKHSPTIEENQQPDDEKEWDDGEEVPPTSSKTNSVKSPAGRQRKSTRLSQNTNSNTSSKSKKFQTNQNLSQITLKSSQRTRKNQATASCFSPPLTRSRLKSLAELGKKITATNTSATSVVKKRRI